MIFRLVLIEDLPKWVGWFRLHTGPIQSDSGVESCWITNGTWDLWQKPIDLDEAADFTDEAFDNVTKI